jgi:hypothetical protein
METVCFSETLIPIYKCTWCHKPEEHCHLHHGENLKSHTDSAILFPGQHCHIFYIIQLYCVVCNRGLGSFNSDKKFLLSKPQKTLGHRQLQEKDKFIYFSIFCKKCSLHKLFNPFTARTQLPAPSAWKLSWAQLKYLYANV